MDLIILNAFMHKDSSLAALRLNTFCKVEEKDECLQLGTAYTKGCSRTALSKHSSF